ncbi:MAG: helix-turn-helix domain-containing protein [Ruminococcaceae bacterium]|nr:helix-turn-helix domain-containing protein [Oscillospiraceae bacterium]
MWHFHPIPRPVMLSGVYTAFSRDIAADYVFRGETHDFYELVLVTQGRVGVTADANSFVLEAGSAILHPPREFHSLHGVGAPASFIIFSFSAERMPVFTHFRFAVSDENMQRAARALDIFRTHTPAENEEIGDVPEGEERAVQQALCELEILLLTLTEKTQKTQHDASAGARNYRRALRVIEENLTEPLDTATLARLAHMSPSLLKKTFSRYAGVGVMEYIRTRKINFAIPLLRAGKSVKEIAADLGFSDAGYFSTVFRRITGHSPTYYRRGY